MTRLALMNARAHKGLKGAVYAGLLTKYEVKVAGYWPRSFASSLWTESESKSINTQKRMRQIFNHLD